MSEIATIIALSGTLVSAIAAFYSFYTTKNRLAKVKRLFGDLEKTYNSVLEIDTKEKFDISDISKFKTEVLPLLNEATKAMHVISGKEVSSAIKLLHSSDDKSALELITFLRDFKSTSKREVLDYKYPIKTNLAYKKIFEYGNEFCLDNDISSPSQGGYINDKRNVLGSVYKSVLAVPLLVKDAENNKHVLGALVFDSKQENAFDSKAVEYAKRISELIMMYLQKSNYDNNHVAKGITNRSS